MGICSDVDKTVDRTLFYVSVRYIVLLKFIIYNIVSGLFAQLLLNK